MTVLVLIGLWILASVMVSLLIGRAISMMGEDTIVTAAAETEGPVGVFQSQRCAMIGSRNEGADVTAEPRTAECRARADECRALANRMSDEQRRQKMLKLAETWEVLARESEHMETNLIYRAG